jgi:thiamine-phosphate pyrophosphorylase
MTTSDGVRCAFTARLIVVPDRLRPVIANASERLAQARLYLVCDLISEERLDAALRGGVDIVQLRCKAATDSQILAAARRFAEVCARHEVPLILNDRPDLVAAAGADGVHLGQDDLPVAAAREIVGSGATVGLSTHSPAQIDSGTAQAVDYIGVGPVYATPTKPGRAPVGASLVAYAAHHARLPFFAIGGIDTETIGAVVEAGARRVAVVRAITAAQDPERAASQLRAALETEAGVGAT